MPARDFWRPFATACRSRANLRRALITAVVVGPLLSAINQTHLVFRLLHGESIPTVAALRIALTFLVPFFVSLVSAALADARRLTQV